MDSFLCWLFFLEDAQSTFKKLAVLNYNYHFSYNKYILLFFLQEEGMKTMICLKARYMPYITQQYMWKQKHPAGPRPSASELRSKIAVEGTRETTSFVLCVAPFFSFPTVVIETRILLTLCFTLQVSVLLLPSTAYWIIWEPRALPGSVTINFKKRSVFFLNI